MAARLGEGVGASIERWLAGLAGPELDKDPYAPAGNSTQSPSSYADAGEDAYDEDFEYYWGNVRIPLWIALIWQVPWRQRLDIFVIGFVVGLVIAGIAVLWGLVLAQY